MYTKLREIEEGNIRESSFYSIFNASRKYQDVPDLKMAFLVKKNEEEYS